MVMKNSVKSAGIESNQDVLLNLSQRNKTYPPDYSKKASYLLSGCLTPNLRKKSALVLSDVQPKKNTISSALDTEPIISLLRNGYITGDLISLINKITQIKTLNSSFLCYLSERCQNCTYDIGNATRVLVINFLLNHTTTIPSFEISNDLIHSVVISIFSKFVRSHQTRELTKKLIVIMKKKWEQLKKLFRDLIINSKEIEITN
jgi:hypothetical protein